MALVESINKQDIINTQSDILLSQHLNEVLDFNKPIQELKFITITIRPNVITTPSGKKQTAKKQYQKTNQSLNNMLDAYTLDYIKIAELTKQGAIHYHALIQITDINQAVLTDCINSSRFFGNTRIDDITTKTTDDIKQYLLKDWNKTFYVVNRLCKHEDDIIDIFNSKTHYAEPVKQINLLERLSNNQEETTQHNFNIDFSY
ncbi:MULTISPECIES: rolling circle replication-associated protein [Pseudomonadati]